MIWSNFYHYQIILFGSIIRNNSGNQRRNIALKVEKMRKGIKRLSSEERRATVQRLELEGVPQFKIAKRLGVATSTVSRDLAKIREAYAERRADDWTTRVELEYARIDHIWKSVWEEINKTKREKKRVSPKYYDALCNCVEKRLKILGIYDKKTDGGKDIAPTIDVRAILERFGFSA